MLQFFAWNNLLSGFLAVCTLVSSVNLLIYFLGTLFVVVLDDETSTKGQVPLIQFNIPVIGLCYSSLSAFLILQVIGQFRAISTLPVTLINELFNKATKYPFEQESPEPWFICILSIIILQVVTALVCNCSRAFYTLNTLEKGKIDDDTLEYFYKDKKWNRRIEVFLRFVAVIIFILLEQSLSKLSNSENLKNDVFSLLVMSLILYTTLLIWLFNNLIVMKKPILKSPLLYQFFGGIFLCAYLFILLQDSWNLETYTIFLLITWTLSFIGSLFVIGIVTFHSLSRLEKILRDFPKFIQKIFT